MFKRRMMAVLVGATLLLSAAAVSAQQPCCGGRGLGHMEALEALELTETQRAQVKDLFSGLERKRIKLRADLQLKKLELQEAMHGDKVDEGRVRKLVKDMGSLKTELHMARVEQQLGLMKVLTPDQLKQLRQHRMMGGMMGGKMGLMKKMKCGPGGQCSGQCKQGVPCPKGGH